MSNRPRQHHYVPKFYLAGFTVAGTDEGELYVVDQAQAKGWPTSPAKAAKQRDYYAVDLGPDVDPNVIEQKVLAPLEGEFSRVIRAIAEHEQLPPRDDENPFSIFTIFLNFLALMAVRVPRTRALATYAASGIVKNHLRETLSTTEGWEQFKREVRAMGHQVGDEEHEKYRQLALSDEYQVDLDQTTHVQTMVNLSDGVLHALAARDWTLGIALPDAPDLICSDVPLWIAPTKDTDRSHPLKLNTPNTFITFPLTRRLIALGHFGELPSIIQIKEKGIAKFNSMTAIEATQIYASSPVFVYWAAEGAIWQGTKLLEFLRNQKPQGPENQSESDDELSRLFDELRVDPSTPPLPAEFSRGDIYADHD